MKAVLHREERVETKIRILIETKDPLLQREDIMKMRAVVKVVDTNIARDPDEKKMMTIKASNQTSCFNLYHQMLDAFISLLVLLLTLVQVPKSMTRHESLPSILLRHFVLLTKFLDQLFNLLNINYLN